MNFAREYNPPLLSLRCHTMRQSRWWDLGNQFDRIVWVRHCRKLKARGCGHARGGVRGMGWVRRYARFGSWLALAALALQLVLSFGHIHLDGVHRAHPLWF